MSSGCVSTGRHLKQHTHEKAHVAHGHCQGTRYATGTGMGHGWARLWGAGSQPCWIPVLVGAGADGPRAEVGSWVGG